MISKTVSKFENQLRQDEHMVVSRELVDYKTSDFGSKLSF